MTDEHPPITFTKSGELRAPGWRHVLTADDLKALRFVHEPPGNPIPGFIAWEPPPIAAQDAAKGKFRRAMAPFIATMKQGEVVRRGVDDIEAALFRAFRMLVEWLDDHRSKIRQTWLAEMDGHLVIVVTCHGLAYDEHLHDDLMITIGKIQNSWMMSVPLKCLILPPVPLAEEPEGHAPTVSFLIDT